MPSVRTERPYQHLWESIRRILRDQHYPSRSLNEELSFFVYRSDTNAVLARGIYGYEEAKRRADQIRRSQKLPWSVEKFRAERRTQAAGGGGAQGEAGQRWRFGVSADGRTFTNVYGRRGRIDYAPRYNPSKGRRLRGYTDAQGNYHDID